MLNMINFQSIWEPALIQRLVIGFEAILENLLRLTFFVDNEVYENKFIYHFLFLDVLNVIRFFPVTG